MQAMFPLRDALADSYPDADQQRNVVLAMGFNPGALRLGSNAVTTWETALRKFTERGVLDRLAEYAAGDGQEHLVELVLAYARQEQSDADRQAAARDTAPSDIGAVDWHGPEGGSDLEKIIGARSSLVSVSYFEKGLDRARSVARVVLEDGTVGTGFVVSGNRLLTNHHVLPHDRAAATAKAEFNYQQTAAGTDASMRSIALLPETHCSLEADDWAVVDLAEDAEAEWGAIPLQERSIDKGDFVNIIQHPGGGPKKISMAANVVVHVGGGRVQYLTDTLPGSSGSPVFDRDWNLVALHHSGGWLKEPNARSKSTYYRNQGIAVGRILEGLG